MADLPTQAQITRAAKAAIRAAHDMGYKVASYKVTFSQGVPTVDVTMGAESAPSPDKGGANVENLKERLKAYRRA